eukprot:COSAG01_NODE_69320_length_261_cov_1.746914_2_plen_41_part_01
MSVAILMLRRWHMNASTREPCTEPIGGVAGLAYAGYDIIS